MKKIVFIFLILSLLPLMSAAEITMKDNFSQGETLIAKVSGNFYQPITNDNIEFDVGHEITSIIPTTKQLGDDFYIYAQLTGKSPDNYSIIIKNIKYYQSGQLVEGSLTKNFSITNKTSDFSINPGVLVVSKNFSIDVMNLRDSEIKVTASSEVNTSGGFFGFGSSKNETTYTIGAAKTQKINFDINQFNETGLKLLELSTNNTEYQVPVYVTNISKKPQENNFRIEPSTINVTMSTNSNTTRTIYVNNIGASLDNVTISISDSLKPYLVLSRNSTNEVRQNSSFRIDINITSPSAEKNIEGQITVNSGDVYSYAAVFLTFIKDYVPSNENVSTILKCSQINGNLCKDSTKCSGDVRYASDGICCLGVCSEVKKSSTAKYIGWLIILLIIGVIVWFYLRRYKNIQSVADFSKFIGKK